MNRPAPWRSIMTSVVDRRPFRIGAATVDPVSRDATWPGGHERLQPQTMKVLVALLSHRGEVVTRDELVQLCWDGRIVGDDVINRSILLLRHFAERASGFEIETVPRTGYRLIETPIRVRSPRRKLAIAASAAGLVVLAAISVGTQFSPRKEPEQAAALTIGLLPFVADSPDAQTAKLASASREAVANTLAQGAYSVTTVDSVPQAARAPSDFLISARFDAISGKVVATVRMEETAHHVLVFTHRFEEPSDKADDLPEIIGGQMASQVSWSAPLVAVERKHPSDPTIIASFFQASSAGLEGAGELHDYESTRRIAAKDPNSPLAQLDFAFNTAFALDEIPREQRGEAVAAARTAANRAVTLAPEFGDTFVPWCLLHSEQRMVECENHLRAGMRSDPDSPFAGWFLGNLILNPVGRNDEALELARAALAHDPYMPAKIGLMLRMLEATGRSDEAEDLYRRSMHWWPNDAGLNAFRMSGIAQRGDFEGLRRFLDAVGDRKKPNGTLLAISRKSRPAIRAACAAARGFDGNVCLLALSRFGESDAAFGLADRLYPSRRGRSAADDERIWLDNPDSNEIAFLTSAAASALRSDPRFLPLADRVGLLDYWRTGRLPDFCTKAHEPVCARIMGRRS
jgi:DNA-binding winged helix-turn-helix (wHTH) protein/tetratricopeptide (TPR) repeat protein